MNLLLISNSTNYGEPYLRWPKPYIKEFAEKHGFRKVLFIPYAGISLSLERLETSYDVYEMRVKEVFKELGLEVESIHRKKNPLKAIFEAQAIAVGGGNTFHLVYQMQLTGLMQAIAERVKGGVPYMGWSAGSNVACPTLMTTNDMPIIKPPSFECMGLIPFQINPHYLDKNPKGHGGETREARIEEFLIVNPHLAVAGLREGTLLEVSCKGIELRGARPMRLFKAGVSPQEFEPGSDISFLLKE